MNQEIEEIAAKFEAQVMAQGKTEQDLDGVMICLTGKEVYYMLAILLNPGNWRQNENTWGED